MTRQRTHFGALMVLAVCTWCGGVVPLYGLQRDVLAAAPAAVPDFAKNVPVKVGGERISLDDAIRDALADRRLTSYRQLREEYSSTAAGQLELARWCRRQGLADEERLHWQMLLMIEPDQPEAIKGLGLRRYQGSLLTKPQIEDAKKERKLAREAERKWAPKLKQIKLAIEEGDEKAREAALDELEAIRDPHAMEMVEKMFANSPQVAMLIVELYARAAEKESIEALVRLAIHSKDAAVREKAASELRYRPVESYMPLLVGALAAPIEMSLRADVEFGGPTFERYEGRAYTGRVKVGLYGVVRLSGNYTNRDVLFWVYEEKPFTGALFTGYEPDRHQVQYVLSCDSPDPSTPYEFHGGFEALGAGGPNGREPESMRRSIAALEKRIRELNEASAETNLRIDAAIREATKANAAAGQPSVVTIAADVRPRLWWDWWQQQLNLNNYFAKGTEVWTQLGIRPIEEILVGDRVLTKKPDTGELTFNLVIGIDTQLKRAVTTVEVGNRTIVSTPEQPFSVSDESWQKAAALKPGMRIDSLAGPQRIENIRTGTADATFSLLIADQPNYYVDRQGILVHDATRP